MFKTVKKGQKNPKKSFLLFVGITIIIALAGFLIFSVYSYQSSEQEKEGFFTCSQDGKICELSQHIHAQVEINVCGEKITLSKEEGELNKTHTHKESSTIHWHEKMQVDPATREPLDPTPLKISSFLQQMNYKFPNSCSDNSNPILSVTVNGSEVSEKLDYAWKDGDAIIIEYK